MQSFYDIPKKRVPRPWRGTGPRTLWGPETLWEPRTLWGSRTQWGPKTLGEPGTLGGLRTLQRFRTLGLRILWELRVLWWPRKDAGTYKLANVSWFSHYIFNLWNLQLEVDLFIIAKNKNMLKLKIVKKLKSKAKNMFETNRAVNYFSSCKNRCYNCYMQSTDQWEFVELCNE